MSEQLCTDQTKLSRVTERTAGSMYNGQNSASSESHKVILNKLSCPCGPASHQLSPVWPIYHLPKHVQKGFV